MASKPLIVCRQGAALFAATPGTAEAIARIPSGKLATITIKRPRSIKWHALYWTLVTLVSDNSSYSPDDVHNLLKLKAGLVRELRERDGTVWRIPDSIAFDAMDGIQWAAYWDKVVDVVLAEFMPVSPETLKQELSALCGLHPDTVR